jgi:hypothetical protein
VVDTIIDFDSARIEHAYRPPKRQHGAGKGGTPAATGQSVRRPSPYAIVSVRRVREGGYVLLVAREHKDEIEEIPLPIPEAAYVRFLRVRKEANGVPVEFRNQTGRPDQAFGFPEGWPQPP